MKLKSLITIIACHFIFMCLAQDIVIIEEAHSNKKCDSIISLPLQNSRSYILFEAKTYFKHKGVIIEDTCMSLNRFAIKGKKYANAYIPKLEDIKDIEDFFKIASFNDSHKMLRIKRRKINPHKFFYSFYRQYVGYINENNQIVFHISFKNRKAFDSEVKSFLSIITDSLYGRRKGKNYYCEIIKGNDDNFFLDRVVNLGHF